MILKKLKIQVYKNHITNCYIVFDENTKETIVIDPAGDVDKICEMIKTFGGDLKYIFLTHCHVDHIMGVQELKDKCGGKILIHRDEAKGLTSAEINLSEKTLGYKIEFGADSRLDDNDLIHLGNLAFKVIHTPGHTCGGICLYCKEEELLFSGDTLFKGTWGRTDLPTGSREDIMDSIIKKLLILPDDTIVYPGHGRETKIKEEKPIYLELKPSIE